MDWVSAFTVRGTASAGRVILAATCGGLLGLVLGTADGPLQLGGISLQLAAWAFFLGYALEPVLKTLDTVIEVILNTLRAQVEEKKEVPIGAPK